MTTIDQAEFDILAGIAPVVAALTRLGARYAITGSLAAIAHRVGRTVDDVDLVADLSLEQVPELVLQLLPRYAVDHVMVEQALCERTRFSLIDLTMLLKVDIVLPRDRVLDCHALDRARPTTVARDMPQLSSVMF